MQHGRAGPGAGRGRRPRLTSQITPISRITGCTAHAIWERTPSRGTLQHRLPVTASRVSYAPPPRLQQ